MWLSIDSLKQIVVSTYLIGVGLSLAACTESASLRPITTQPPPATPTITSADSISITQERDTRRLTPNELLLAADNDAIPALFVDDTVFVDAASGDQEWTDDDLIIGLEINGDARAYPIRLLSLHEIVNDTVGGQPVAVTWCPLCFSAIVFDRVIESHGAPRELTFGVSGFLYRNNLVMYDHQTNTLWSQLLGEALRGAQKGTLLKFYGSSLSSWGEWKAAHPDTRVISAEKLGRRADEIIDPYTGYYASGTAGFDTGAERDDTLNAKQLIAGLVLEDEVRAYDLLTLTDVKIINDQLGAFPVVVLFDEGFSTAHTYLRTVDNQILTFESAEEPTQVRDRETGSIWDMRSGIAQSGPLAGARLSRLSAPLVFWFAWTDIYPQTDVYKTDS